MTEEEFDKIKELAELNAKIIADLQGRLTFFSELLQVSVSLKEPIEFSQTEIDGIIGRGDSWRIKRDGFTDEMTKFNLSKITRK